MELDRDSIHRRAIRLGAAACLAALAEASQMSSVDVQLPTVGPVLGLAVISFGLGALMFRAMRRSSLCTR